MDFAQAVLLALATLAALLTAAIASSEARRARWRASLDDHEARFAGRERDLERMATLMGEYANAVYRSMGVVAAEVWKSGQQFMVSDRLAVELKAAIGRCTTSATPLPNCNALFSSGPPGSAALTSLGNEAIAEVHAEVSRIRDERQRTRPAEPEPWWLERLFRLPR